jgi:hypothetical protein
MDDTATLRRDWDKMDTLERIHAQKEGRLPPPFGGEEAEDPRIYNLIRGGSRKGYHRLRIVREDGSYFNPNYGFSTAI